VSRLILLFDSCYELNRAIIRLTLQGIFMNSSNLKWVWQQPDWPNLHWQDEKVQPLLRDVRLEQGVLLGKVGAMDGDVFNKKSALDTLLQNIITSSAIEGEQLNVQSVRSSLARRFGLKQMKSYPVSERSEGLVKIMFDAINEVDIAFNANPRSKKAHFSHNKQCSS